MKIKLCSFKSSDDLKRKEMGHTHVSGWRHIRYKVIPPKCSYSNRYELCSSCCQFRTCYETVFLVSLTENK